MKLWQKKKVKVLFFFKLPSVRAETIAKNPMSTNKESDK